MYFAIRCPTRAGNVHFNQKVTAMSIEDRLVKLEQDIAALQKEKQEGGELVLDKLTIRDKEGRNRIVLVTDKDGDAGITHFDADGKIRIELGIDADGTASIIHADANEKMRIGAGTYKDGNAGIEVYDANDKPVGTLP